MLVYSPSVQAINGFLVLGLTTTPMTVRPAIPVVLAV
jgi:hypothetical protein